MDGERQQRGQVLYDLVQEIFLRDRCLQNFIGARVKRPVHGRP